MDAVEFGNFRENTPSFNKLSEAILKVNAIKTSYEKKANSFLLTFSLLSPFRLFKSPDLVESHLTFHNSIILYPFPVFGIRGNFRVSFLFRSVNIFTNLCLPVLKKRLTRMCQCLIMLQVPGYKKKAGLKVC